MAHETGTALRGSVVGDGLQLTAIELCRACGTSEQQVEIWVVEGVLQPEGGATREEWRFGAAALARLRVATRLAHDLEVNDSGVAIALDLLDRIASLESHLLRLGALRDEKVSR